MGGKSPRCEWPWVAAVVLVMVAGLTVFISGQQGVVGNSLRVPILRNGPQGPPELQGLVDDWSHHHLVFSNPGTEEDAIREGRHDEWLRIVNDPRYVMQQLKRRAPAQGPAAEYVDRMNEIAREQQEAGEGTDLAGDALEDSLRPEKGHRPVLRSRTIQRDWSMDLGTGTVGAGMYPAKYSFSTTNAGLCNNSTTPDYVVYNTGKAGSNTSPKQANIIAYDNIYSGCNGVTGASTTVPVVYWAYYTGTGTAATSVVLSEDGTKVAFIENTSSGAILRIVKFKGGQGTNYSAPVAPDHVLGSGSAWSSCTSGSCLISVAFANGNQDTLSSPFCDYTNDVIYVGDSGGYLHRFSGVFLGTPAETGSPWPVQMSVCPLGSPVYDPTSSNVFADAGTGCSNFGGRFHHVGGAATGVSPVSSAQLANTGGTGWGEGPLVDSVAARVYAFAGDNFSGGNAVIYQLSTTFASNASATAATLGTGSTSATLYSGSFDNAYFTSTSTSPTGHLWVCGDSGGNPALYPVPISGNTMTTGAITAATTVSATATTCSPVTEFCTNGGAACTSTAGTDYIFVSPQTEPSSGQVTGCNASEGCVISYTVSGTVATRKGAGAFPGGASGMIVDTQNTSPSGTLQLYFSNLAETLACGGAGGVGTGTGGCGIQASQTAP